MSNLVERTEEMYGKIDVVMTRLMKTIGLESIGMMDDEDLLTFRDCLKLIDESKQYSLEVAARLDKIDSIDKKLDHLEELIRNNKNKQ